jgi:hypothetical protein
MQASDAFNQRRDSPVFIGEKAKWMVLGAMAKRKVSAPAGNRVRTYT